MALSFVILLHLVGFVVFVGGALGQRLLLARSSAAGLAATTRDTLEQLASFAASKIELPGILAQVLSGVALIALAPGFLKLHWIHAKLTVVLVLLVTAHLDSINAKRIVRARAAKGEAAEDEIAARKKRQAVMSKVNGVLVGLVLLLVTVLRTAF